MGRLGALLGLSWAVLGVSEAVLGLSWAVLELSGALLGLTWAVLGRGGRVNTRSRTLRSPSALPLGASAQTLTPLARASLFPSPGPARERKERLRNLPAKAHTTVRNRNLGVQSSLRHRSYWEPWRSELFRVTFRS